MTAILRRARLPFFGGQIWILHHRIFHFGQSQIALLAIGRGLDVGVRNALTDQVGFHAGHATFCELLVVLVRTANIGMPFEDEMSVRFGLEIGLEVRRQSLQDPSLTRNETGARPIGRRLSGWIVDTVQSQTGLQNLDLRIRVLVPDFPLSPGLSLVRSAHANRCKSR